jgi:hypothetical protein
MSRQPEMCGERCSVCGVVLGDMEKAMAETTVAEPTKLGNTGTLSVELRANDTTAAEAIGVARVPAVFCISL